MKKNTFCSNKKCNNRGYFIKSTDQDSIMKKDTLNFDIINPLSDMQKIFEHEIKHKLILVSQREFGYLPDDRDPEKKFIATFGASSCVPVYILYSNNLQGLAHFDAGNSRKNVALFISSP